MDILLKDNHFKDTIKLSTLEKSESDQLKTQNYQIGDKYFKVIKNIENKKYVTSFPKLAKQLRDFNIPCTGFINSNDNKEIIEKGTKENKIYFYIQEFISNRFFSGTQDELIQVIPILKK